MSATRARRAIKPSINLPAARLIEALQFLTVAQAKKGEPADQHCSIVNHWAAAQDGILTVAVKIEQDLTACPHTYQLLAALQQTGDELTISQLNESALAVVSGDFKAVVPCEPPLSIYVSGPDERVATVNDAVKAALAVAAVFPMAGAENPRNGAVLLQANTAVGTDGFAMMEAWHGVDLPPGLVIPKQAAEAVAKCKKKLVGLGFSMSSVTFYFDDESWIKTQRYAEEYHDYAPYFGTPGLLWEVPKSFFVGINAIATFSKNGIVYFQDEIMLSNEVEVDATTYRVEGLPQNMAFDAKKLKLASKWFQKAEFKPDTNRVYFFGDNVRGVIMACSASKPHTPPMPKTGSDTTDLYDDDIPF